MLAQHLQQEHEHTTSCVALFLCSSLKLSFRVKDIVIIIDDHDQSHGRFLRLCGRFFIVKKQIKNWTVPSHLWEPFSGILRSCVLGG